MMKNLKKTMFIQSHFIMVKNEKTLIKIILFATAWYSIMFNNLALLTSLLVTHMTDMCLHCHPTFCCANTGCSHFNGINPTAKI